MTWLDEAGLPKKGSFALTYSSVATGCVPDPQLRGALSALCLAEAVETDAVHRPGREFQAGARKEDAPEAAAKWAKFEWVDRLATGTVGTRTVGGGTVVTAEEA